MESKHFADFRKVTDHNIKGYNSLPGGAHLVIKDGRCVFAHADGWANIERKKPFRLDTICPLHGASKPLVVAAFLTLVEDGVVRLTDPVEQHVPFPTAVATSSGGLRNIKARATIAQVLAMTAGIGYDDFAGYRRTMRRVTRKGFTLGHMCKEILEAPLQSDPGKRYQYSFSTDVLGYLCESISGDRIDRFVEKRVLRPLGMCDTHFAQSLPSHKRHRVAVMYAPTDPPSKRKQTPAVRRQMAPETGWILKRASFKRSAPSVMSCGGGVLSYADYGMMSTATDYARFCQMLLQGGIIPGSDQRLLQEATLRPMWRDGLAPFQRSDGRVAGWHDSPSPVGQPKDFWETVGWSLLNTHLVFKSGPRPGPPRQSEVMWMGGGGGAFWKVDAGRGVVSVSFCPSIGGRETLEDGLGPLANDVSVFAAAAADGGRMARRRSAAARSPRTPAASGGGSAGAKREHRTIAGPKATNHSVKRSRRK